MSSVLDALPQRVSSKALASRLGVSARTLRDWSRQCPDFPQPLKVNQKLLWDMAAVAAWLKTREREGAGNAL
jgi:hypothetical protein